MPFNKANLITLTTGGAGAQKYCATGFFTNNKISTEMKMNLGTFYDELLKLVPYKDGSDKPFRTRLEQSLNRYETLIGELVLDGNAVALDTKSEISSICRKIKEIVKTSMEGEPSAAFRKLSYMLNGYQKNPPKIDLGKLVISISEGESFYRVRCMNSVCDIKRKDLFHIPIPKRGIVKSCRYSSPGYPCLYLGKSFYGCWEEMRRPPMFQCAVARFKNEQKLNFIDLTIPSKEKMKDSFYQKLMPLVIACMIKVSDDQAIYKPEYIVPQLLIEWILKYRADERYVNMRPIHGVAYHSTQMHKEFEFPKDKLINYAIPVFEVDPSIEHCPTLSGTFSLTEPKFNEIEKLRGDYPIHLWEKIPDPDGQLAMNYGSSAFGTLEDWLSNEAEFPLELI